jgi:hypothetical protein
LPANKAGLVGVDDCLDAVAQPELRQHPPEVCLHRCLSEEEPLLPLEIGSAIINDPAPAAFGPWTGLFILCGYTALTLAVGTVLLVRRDA